MLRAYRVVDGIPLYLKQFRDGRDFWENVERILLRKESRSTPRRSFF
ncbi:hypothetical protein [Thermococcus sp.]